jgi:TM2 domain-containing membrane protein YozV
MERIVSLVAEVPQVGNDTLALMRFETNRKSVGVSYLLWFLLGLFGGHRFYNRRFGSAIAQLLLSIVGLILSFAGVGFIVLGIVWIWIIIDLFLIPGMVKRHNSELVEAIGLGRPS